MTTSLAERRAPGKITRNRLVKQSRASGNVARRHSLPDYLQVNEVELLLNLAPHAEARLEFLLQWRAGLRVGEALALEPKDLLLADCENPTIRVRHGKGDRERLIPVHPELRGALVSFLAYSPVRKGSLLPYNPSTAWRWLQAALSAAHRQGALMNRQISTHTFRHSAARHWLASGVPLNHVQRWLGHANLLTTAIYLEILPDPVGYMERVP